MGIVSRPLESNLWVNSPRNMSMSFSAPPPWQKNRRNIGTMYHVAPHYPTISHIIPHYTLIFPFWLVMKRNFKARKHPQRQSHYPTFWLSRRFRSGLGAFCALMWGYTHATDVISNLQEGCRSICRVVKAAIRKQTITPRLEDRELSSSANRL